MSNQNQGPFTPPPWTPPSKIMQDPKPEPYCPVEAMEPEQWWKNCPRCGMAQSKQHKKCIVCKGVL
jgi:hypothetical protein